MAIPPTAIRIIHTPRFVRRPLLTSIGGGVFRINADALRVLATHAPRSVALRTYLSRSGRVLWLEPRATLEDGDIPLTWVWRSDVVRDPRTPWPARRGAFFASIALERLTGIEKLRLPMTWDSGARAFRVDLPRRPVAAHVYYDHPFTVTVWMATRQE